MAEFLIFCIIVFAIFLIFKKHIINFFRGENIGNKMTRYADKSEKAEKKQRDLENYRKGKLLMQRRKQELKMAEPEAEEIYLEIIAEIKELNYAGKRYLRTIVDDHTVRTVVEQKLRKSGLNVSYPANDEDSYDDVPSKVVSIKW